ncbi:MAG: hypothetical protein ABIZ04_12510 [Opitutus sp.]
MDDFTRSMLSKPNETVSEYEPYQSPMLVFVYQIGGVLFLIAGIVAPFALGLSASKPLIGACLLYGIGTAVVCFGVAQLINLGGRTEYHARKLHLIEKHLERIVKS